MSSPNQQQSQSYASITQTIKYPKRDEAIIFDYIEQFQLKDYALSLSKIIDPSHIRYLSRISKNRICVFFSSKNVAEELMTKHKFLNINDTRVPMRPLISNNKRVLLSNVSPIIPNKLLEEKFNRLGIKILSPISNLRAGLNEPGFSHILSFRRQFYVSPLDYDILPDSMQVEFEDATYRIFISSDTTCYICRKEGHIASNCNQNQENEVIPTVEEDITNKEAYTDEYEVAQNKTVDNLQTHNIITCSQTTVTAVQSNVGLNIEANISTFKRPHPSTISSSCSSHSQTNMIINQESRSGDEMSDSDSVYSQCSQNKFEDCEEKNGSKKKRKNFQIECLDINWKSINEIIELSQVQYPISGPQLKTFLEDTFGIQDIKEYTLQHTQDIEALIKMLTELRPNIQSKRLKGRFTRLIKKLKEMNI